MDIIEFVALGSAIAAFIAVFFAWRQARAASDQVKLARRQTEVQERLYREAQQPYVWCDYRVDPISAYVVDLVVKNEGPTVARNVRIGIDPMIRRTKPWDDEPLEDLSAFRTVISSIPPGREMRWSLGVHHELFDEKALGRHEIEIRFDGPFGPVEPVKYTLNYEDMAQSSIREHGTLKGVVDALKKIESKLS